jgi:regulator of replication initiation timing
MSATVKLQVSFESLIEAIATLDLENKRHLLEILEDQIFETEEDEMENRPEVLAEVEEARKAYQAGDYQTIQEYIDSRSHTAS